MSSLNETIRKKALELGFDAFGVAAVSDAGHYRERFMKWLENGYHGRMSYMERNTGKRLDPGLLHEGARSVIVVAQNYFPDRDLLAEKQRRNSLKVAKYAWGKDYHYVIREKLGKLIESLETLVPGSSSRAFTDSAPVLERAWAERAGIGWTGKNACLIIPRKGSFFFIGEVITTAVIEPDRPFGNDLCGSCVRCMQACPTKAIVSPGVIDARRCISYLTIELKEPIPDAFRNQCHGWIFGCDICQDVCPYNRNAVSNREPQFRPLEPHAGWTDDQWRNLQKAGFRKALVKAGSAMSRVKYEKLMGNIMV